MFIVIRLTIQIDKIEFQKFKFKFNIFKFKYKYKWHQKKLTSNMITKTQKI